MASASVQELEPQLKTPLSSYQTALAILLPSSSPYYKDISTLRSLYDKNFEIWPAHINLLYPFVAPEYLPTAVDTIRKYLTIRYNSTDSEAVPPLTIKLDTAGIWKHSDNATVYLSESAHSEDNSTEPGNLKLSALRQELLNLFSTSAGVEAREYTPHLTIGQTALNEEVMMGLLGKAQKLVANAGSDGIQWNASRLVVFQRGAAKSGMKIVSEVALGREPVEEGYGCESVDSEHDSPQKFGSHYVYVFSSAGSLGTYVPLAHTPSESKSPDAQDLTLATYNVFTESAMPTPITKSRYSLLLSAILSISTTILNLQEVTDDFLAYLLSQSEIQRRFPYSTHSPSHGILPSWRNCVTLARYPLGDENGMWKFVELGRHKGAVVVELNFGCSASASLKGSEEGEYRSDISKINMKKRLVIANVHLTCGISDASSAAKLAQLRILSSYFRNRKISQDYTEAWAICGDFNTPTSHLTIQTAYHSQEISQETYNLLLNNNTNEDGKRIIPEMWKDTYTLTKSVNGITGLEDLKFDVGEDSGGNSGGFTLSGEPGTSYVWRGPLALGPGEFGATFNPFTNRLCAESVKWGANPRPQRYDRILVSRNAMGSEQNWIEVKNTGRFGLEGGSDHWGLYTEIRIRDSTTECKGTSLGQKKCLKLESRLQPNSGMTDEVLEQYLRDSGMIPSQRDYEVREEAKSVLTMILTGESGKHHQRQTPPPVHNGNFTPMQHLRTPTHGSTQYHDTEGESIIPLIHQTQTLGFKEKPRVKILVQAVGSYYMNLFTPTSDVDILCASNISTRVFWVLVKQKIRRHNRTLSETGEKAGSIRILRTVEAQSGTMMELEYTGSFTGVVTSQVPKSDPEDKDIVGTAGIYKAGDRHYRVRIDLQYCQVSERVLNSWTQLPYLSQSDPIFSLPATTLKKLNAYRDSSFLLQTIPNLKLFRLTYRLLKFWATRRGIFSARFGYLGGIHLALLLSHICKRIPVDQVTDLTAFDLLKLFFENYGGFNYEEDTVGDPDFASPSPYRRTVSREPLVITTIHPPMVNVADTASQHTRKTIRDQILLANRKLDKGSNWDEVTGRSDGEAEREFLNTFANFIKIDVRYWGRNTARGRSLVGWIESRCVYLLVELNAKAPNMHARIWPHRFVNVNEPHADEELNAFYLIGLQKADVNQPRLQDSEEVQGVNEQKKMAYNKFMEILRSFEEYLREAEKKHEVTESYVSVNRVTRQSLGEGVGTDKRVWWDEDYINHGTYDHDCNPNGGEDDEDSLGEEDSASDSGELEEERGRILSAGRLADDQTLDVRDENDNTQKRTRRSLHKRRNNQVPDEISMDAVVPRQEYLKKAKLRPAHDIINRIKWDPEMKIHDYIVGYVDRFLGILQMNLEKWVGHRRDETDEEWMPMHRVVWITRASDGEVVWHKEKRIDTIFGSGDQDTLESTRRKF